jgi:hypothetical protein
VICAWQWGSMLCARPVPQSAGQLAAANLAAGSSGFAASFEWLCSADMGIPIAVLVAVAWLVIFCGPGSWCQVPSAKPHFSGSRHVSGGARQSRTRSLIFPCRYRAFDRCARRRGSRVARSFAALGRCIDHNPPQISPQNEPKFSACQMRKSGWTR